MTLLRRLTSLLLFCTALVGMGASAAPITVTDIAGRKVTLPKPATRVVLAQARYLPMLGILTPDPVAILAGWSDEFKTSYASDYEDYLAKYPALAKVPTVGRHTAETFSVETTLALRPDLVILTSAFAGIRPGTDPSTSPLVRAFDAAGVPVVVVDFFMKPLENTVPSIRILGQALGHEDRANAFIAFYESHMKRIGGQTAEVKDKPPVFVHAHAGSTDCCNSPGVGTFNDMISFAGGHNIGADVIKSATGALGFEYINSRNPLVYVATGTGAGRRSGTGLAIGAGVDTAASQASLRRVVNGAGLGALSAVREGNAHGIWHGFNDSPLHVVFIESLARWIDPVRFKDVSPQQTLDEINTKFLAVPLRGTYMVDLPAAPGGAAR
jgi:iron complex transport system substrate-binding protein